MSPSPAEFGRHAINDPALLSSAQCERKDNKTDIEYITFDLTTPSECERHVKSHSLQSVEDRYHNLLTLSPLQSVEDLLTLLLLQSVE
jgi:hypothetical protein